MNAEELREAMETTSRTTFMVDATSPEWVPGSIDALRIALNAARTIALPILEADEELVERVATALFDAERSEPVGERGRTVRIARAVLVALIPKKEETRGN